MGQIQFDAILAAGGIPIMMPLTDQRLLLSLLKYVMAFVLLVVMMLIHVVGEEPRDLNRLSPHERCARFELVKQVLAADKPLLAICRGLQLLNIVLGGTLIRFTHA